MIESFEGEERKHLRLPRDQSPDFGPVAQFSYRLRNPFQPSDIVDDRSDPPAAELEARLTPGGTANVGEPVVSPREVLLAVRQELKNAEQTTDTMRC
jgi:hypothetical protein